MDCEIYWRNVRLEMQFYQVCLHRSQLNCVECKWMSHGWSECHCKAVGCNSIEFSCFFFLVGCWSRIRESMTRFLFFFSSASLVQFNNLIGRKDESTYFVFMLLFSGCLIYRNELLNCNLFETSSNNFRFSNFFQFLERDWN